MSRDFLADQALGDLGELLWSRWLKAKGGDPVISDKKCNWDVLDKTTGVYYEVKLDAKAYYWAERRKTTVNLFLEYETVATGKPSGIMTAEASYLIYIVKNPQDLHVAFTFDLEELKKYLWEQHESKRFPIKKPEVNGRGNVRGWTPPISALVNEEGTGFKKLIILPMSLIEHEKDIPELSLLEATNR